MKKFSDRKIIESWNNNVNPWVNAVRGGEIESRVLVTNRAIVEAIVQRAPATVLDIGCGEGWLVRELAKTGIDCLGVDVVPALIDSATQAGGGRFQVLSYEELSPHNVRQRFDCIVCNFSLLGNESVHHVFRQAPALLNNGGAFIVQTIHPITAGGEAEYKDGWRAGSWTGFSTEFCDPAPWYFRTLESWQSLFAENDFKLDTMLEPLNLKTQKPASIIFIGTPII
jgi:2-polyprenyl-3-methyl-5-hydroxy-6-metoxy-1,4-benzoquinol methylase